MVYYKEFGQFLIYLCRKRVAHSQYVSYKNLNFAADTIFASLGIINSGQLDSLNQFFVEYGYWGMAMASFLAGTFVPFSSEAVMGALLVTTDMNPMLTIISGTIGNVMGSMFNYYIGRIGSIEQISRWMHIKERRLVRTRNYVEKKGSWIAVFSFLPIFGTAISISLGILRANVWGVIFWSFVGKFIRYVIVASSAVALR